MFRTGTLTTFLLVANLAPASAQQLVISTYAGGPLATLDAVNASIGAPQSVATDTAGNVYFTSLNRVFKLNSNGGLKRVAGSARSAYSGDGGPAIFADLYLDDAESGWPNGLAIDSAGNLYIADRANGRVRKVSSDGIITTVAGNGNCCFAYSGDGGAATSAQLGIPIGLAFDGTGNLYIADGGSRKVLKVSPSG